MSRWSETLKNLATEIVVPRGAESASGSDYTDDDEAPQNVTRALELTPHVVAETRPPPAPTVPIAQNSVDEASYAALQNQLAKALRDNADLESAVRMLESESARLSAQNKSLTQEKSLLAAASVLDLTQHQQQASLVLDQTINSDDVERLRQRISELETRLSEQAKELSQAIAARDAARRFSSQDRAALAEAQKTIQRLESGGGASGRATPTAPAAGAGSGAPSGPTTEAFNALGRDLKAAGERIAALEALLKEAEATQAEQKKAVHSLESRVKDALDEAGRVKAERDAATQQVATITQQATDAVQQWAASHAQVSALLEETRHELERVKQESTVALANQSSQMVAAASTAEAEAALQAAKAEIRQLEQSSAESQVRTTALMAQLDRLSQDLSAANALLSAQADDLAAKDKVIADSRTKLTLLQEELDNVAKRSQTEAATRRHTEAAANSAAQTVQELSSEVKRLRQLSITVQSLCAETSEQAGRKLNPPSTAHTTPGGTVAASEGPALDALRQLAAEFNSMIAGQRDAQRVLQQWEATYVQAKEVNGSLSQQLEASRRTIKELKEDAALKAASLDRVSGSVHQTTAKINEMQSEVNRLHTAVATEKRRADEAERRIQDALAAAKTAEDARQQALQEVSAIRQQEEDRESELREARASVDNMERVLAAFQSQKAVDIEDRTKYLTYELEEMRKQLLAQTAIVSQIKLEADQQVKLAKRELIQKNSTIATLQTKLGDLRVALEQTMLKINDANSIDKRIVSHLLVNYVCSVREKRGDDMDIVRVMSGLLNWDAESMRRVGLVEDESAAGPGGVRPGAGDNKGSVLLGWGKSLLSGVVGTPRKGPPPPTTSGGSSSAATPSASSKAASLAQMWVDFLIAESDRANSAAAAAAASHVDAAAAPPSLGHSGSQLELPSASAPPVVTRQPSPPTHSQEETLPPLAPVALFRGSNSGRSTPTAISHRSGSAPIDPYPINR